MQSEFFNLPLFSSHKRELLRFAGNALTSSKQPTYLMTPNPEMVVQAWRDRDFLETLQWADLRMCDGIGITLAFRLLRLLGRENVTGPVPRRIPGADFVELLLRQVREEYAFAQDRVVLVGGRGYAATAPGALVLHGVQINWHPGYDSVNAPTKQEEEALCEYLEAQNPAIVFVAFGAPEQERWMRAHHALFQRLDTRLIMAVGGSFDYLTGRVPRAPRWMRFIGGEWLFRLWQQPWRWRRQLRLLVFMVLVGWGAVSGRSPLPPVTRETSRS